MRYKSLMTSIEIQIRTSKTQEIIKEYNALVDINLKLKAGQMKGLTYKQYNKLYKRLKYLHLEMVAGNLIIETKHESLGGNTNSDLLKRETKSYPNRKKLGKKKKGGRRRR